MVMMPVYHFRSFLENLNDENAQVYQFYGVLLYTHANSLQQTIHEYVKSRLSHLDAMTGPEFLVAALESEEGYPGIEDFTPGDVFKIGRFLGVQPRKFPCLVLFVDPNNSDESLVLELPEFLPSASEIKDEDFTEFFSTLSSIVEDSIPEPQNKRLDKLESAINREWPTPSRLEGLIYRDRVIAETAMAATTTFASVASPILAILNGVGRV